MMDFNLQLSTGNWTFVLQPIQGVTLNGRAVVITPSKEGRNRLDTFIHETLHVSSPEMTEAEVNRIAGDISRVLWRAGYRVAKKAAHAKDT
jgi:hypothetical protein